jgi:hypothetical protein
LERVKDYEEVRDIREKLFQYLCLLEEVDLSVLFEAVWVVVEAVVVYM